MNVTSEKPLSARLRECTTAAHENAEQSPFMVHLLEGRLSHAAVADYTGQLRFIYDALEAAVRANGRLGGIADERLERTTALDRDLAELVGPGWREELSAAPATTAYVERLGELGERGDQLGLIAHHYVRYLGDLAGGQIIARMLRRNYGVREEGVNFYDFSGIGKIKPYRDEYRARLDRLDLGEADTARLVDEANRAFACNGMVFRDLAERHCDATTSGSDARTLGHIPE